MHLATRIPEFQSLAGPDSPCAEAWGLLELALRISILGRTRASLRCQEIAPFLRRVHIREDSQELDSLASGSGAFERFGEHEFGTPPNPFEQRRLRLPQTDQPITPVRRRTHYQIERPQFAPGFANVGRRDLRAVGADNHHGFVTRGKGLGKRGSQAAPQVALALRTRPPTRSQPGLNLRDRVVRSKPQLDLWQ